MAALPLLPLPEELAGWRSRPGLGRGLPQPQALGGPAWLGVLRVPSGSRTAVARRHLQVWCEGRRPCSQGGSL